MSDSTSSSQKVTLVLGSGGAKGLAHMEIISLLAADGIIPGAVVGASIGAVVGALYCAGVLDQCREALMRIPRDQFAGFIEPKMPTRGLIGPERIMSWLARYIPPESLIENLPIPFIAITTDYDTGEAVIFDSGPVLEAVRASMSIPGVFPAVRRGEQTFIDGGVANPLPIDIARSRGLSKIIAVNLHPSLKTTAPAARKKTTVPNKKSLSAADIARSIAERTGLASNPFVQKVTRSLESSSDSNNSPQLPSTIDMIMRTIDIMELWNTRFLLETTKPDILLEPDLLDIGSLEFYRTKEAFAEGRKAYESKRNEIMNLVQ